ncbi:hypothetical protein N9M83_03105 [Candidatus Poseidonia alphae]|nr:hypothetical protein [Candidatus Poseidonia alphae]MDA8530112.1 hypothetical protein [Candidatus Poseidonia alphae]MDA8749692.1 hypothetical protein [Candidatus Poseidonia alphae]MDA8759204.1 hypothetical protein [Candidatus Poseidonia alphae]MDA8839329.1 hypothetical protein [Candidatus Poseidonia alphae]
MERQERIGYSMMGAALILVLAGTVGFTVEGTTSIDVVTTGGKTVFSNEALPEHSLGAIVTADLTLNWDRDDIYVVIVDEDEKLRCESSGVLGGFETGSSCTANDADVIAVGMDGTEGLQWTVAPGIHYAGLGTLPGAPSFSSSEVMFDYEVHLHASFGLYFLFFLLGIAGFAYSRMK